MFPTWSAQQARDIWSSRVKDKMALFLLGWTYAIKALDSCKKARWPCDESPRSRQAKILDETYANCVDQTSSRLFYAISAAENLLIFGADVSNAFAEAPPPKQSFYIHLDLSFREWWVHHKKRPPIPPGMVIPILSAMQGHPESLHLWEKHSDAILCKCGFVLQFTNHVCILVLYNLWKTKSGSGKMNLNCRSNNFFIYYNELLKLTKLFVFEKVNCQKTIFVFCSKKKTVLSSIYSHYKFFSSIIHTICFYLIKTFGVLQPICFYV